MIVQEKCKASYFPAVSGMAIQYNKRGAGTRHVVSYLVRGARHATLCLGTTGELAIAKDDSWLRLKKNMSNKW